MYVQSSGNNSYTVAFWFKSIDDMTGRIMYKIGKNCM